MSDWGPPQSPPYAPSPRRTVPKAPIVAGVVILVLIVANVVAAIVTADERDGGLTFGVAVGDCVDIDGPETVDCDDSHDAEVYVVSDFDDDPGEAFPGDERLRTRAAQRCFAEYGDYVAVPFLESRFDFQPLVPDEDEWDDGAREFVCAVVNIDRTPLEGSVRGIGE